MLYSAFTYFCGFKVNSGSINYGLSSIREPKYVNLIKQYLIDIKEDGTFRLDMSYFKYHRGFRMTSRKFEKLFKNKPRSSNQKVTQFYMDMAASVQTVTEEIV